MNQFQFDEVNETLTKLAMEADRFYDIHSEYYKGINDTIRAIRQSLGLPKDERLEEIACLIG